VSDWCVDVNSAAPLVDQPDEAEVLATRPMSYVLAVDNGMFIISVFLLTELCFSVNSNHAVHSSK